MGIEHLLSRIARALKYPVLLLALIALVWVLGEVGALIVELARRRGRSLRRVEQTLPVVQAALAIGDTSRADDVMQQLATTPEMAAVLGSIVSQLGQPQADDRIAKRLADYEYLQLRRLERTRILVRFGPALGLMGTLIPLSPALAGLAHGNVTALSDNLQVAFSVTVTGLLVGAVAFAISLVRDRLYGQDYSDVQYIASILTGPAPQAKWGTPVPSTGGNAAEETPPPVRRLSAPPTSGELA
jgi:biopolymer transport protein ExbB/TolQ